MAAMNLNPLVRLFFCYLLFCFQFFQICFQYPKVDNERCYRASIAMASDRMRKKKLKITRKFLAILCGNMR